MATLNLSIPDELLERVLSRLGSNARENFQEYLLSLLEAFAMDGQPINVETEKKLLEGLDSPIVNMDDAAWAEKLARYDKRHSKRKGA